MLIEETEVPASGMSLATTRRRLLRAAGALGVSSMLPAIGCMENTGGSQSPAPPPMPQTVPLRPFGRTGEQVSSLALGGYFDIPANQPLLSLALDLGVTYWETTYTLGGRGYGDYFARHRGTRDRIFLMAKTQGETLVKLDPAAVPAQVEKDLEKALADIRTDRIDFFVIQGLRDESLLTAGVRRAVEDAKAAGKVRYFGFSTHANMEECLNLASQLDWIDGVMTAYNYRLMQLPGMQRAIEACAARGIALTAIKSQALTSHPDSKVIEETSAMREMLQRFMSGDVSAFQARLHAVWSNPAICSICSMMTDESALRGNVTASWRRDGTSELAARAMAVGGAGAGAGYCTGCANICESRVEGAVPIADVMRCLMYARSYGDRELARMEFGKLDSRSLSQIDYAAAEAHCPQRLPIGTLMVEAVRELG